MAHEHFKQVVLQCGDCPYISTLNGVILFVFLLRLGLDKAVNDGVEEDSTNADRATNQLHGVQRFSKDKGDTNNDNDTLGGVGNRLSDGSGFLEGHGSTFVVSIEPKSRSDKVLPDGGGSLGKFHEFSETRSFLGDQDWKRQDESQDGGDGELVTNGSDAVLQSWGLHELLVFVTTDGRKHVGNAGRDEGGNGKVKFLDGRQDNSTNDNGKTQPLGLGDLLSVNVLGKDGGKGRFGGLDNLGKGDGSHSHGKDRGTVCTHEAEGNGKHLLDIFQSDLGLRTGIGGQPKEESVERTNTQLQRRDGHGETGLSSSSIKSKLVGDVVVVVSKVPKGKVGNEANVKARSLLFDLGGSSADLQGIAGCPKSLYVGKQSEAEPKQHGQIQYIWFCIPFTTSRFIIRIRSSFKK